MARRAARDCGQARDVGAALSAVQRCDSCRDRIVGPRQHVRPRAHISPRDPAARMAADQGGLLEAAGVRAESRHARAPRSAASTSAALRGEINPDPQSANRIFAMGSSKPPTIVDLIWIGDLKFSGTSANASMTLDSAGVAGPSPVQALGFALAGCMTTDVAHILTKGRQPLTALRSHLHADRAQEDPHRFVRMHLHVTVEGGVPADAVARAIALSYEKYC